MSANTYQLKWNNIPPAVRTFLLRAFAILVIWKALYLFILLPNRTLDKPLTYTVGSSAAWLLDVFTGTNAYYSKANDAYIDTDNGTMLMPLQTIFVQQRRLVSIEDPCNALELFVLYAGFIVCMPARIRDKVIYIIGGIILIHIINILRCAGIGYLMVYHPRKADFTHHYLFTAAVYGTIMLLWYNFSKRIVVKPNDR